MQATANVRPLDDFVVAIFFGKDYQDNSSGPVSFSRLCREECFITWASQSASAIRQMRAEFAVWDPLAHVSDNTVGMCSCILRVAQWLCRAQDEVESSDSSSEASAPELSDSESENESVEEIHNQRTISTSSGHKPTNPAPTARAAASASAPIQPPKGSPDVLWRRRPTDKFVPHTKDNHPNRLADNVQVTDHECDSCWEYRIPAERPPTVPAHEPATGSPTLPRASRTEGMYTPLRIFDTLWPTELKEWLVLHMIKAQAALKPRYKLQQITARDVENFLMVSIIMQLVKMPRQTDYWASCWWTGETIIPKIMSGRRYESLQRSLHFYDREHRPGTPGSADFVAAPVAELLARVLKYAQDSYRLGRVASMDEATIKFKGRHGAKQFNGSKPIRRGFKVFVLSDPSGYVWNALLYLGKSTWSFSGGLAVKQEKGAGLYLAEQLLLPVSLMGTDPSSIQPGSAVASRRARSRSGITIVCDRWFTGVKMAAVLREQHGISIVGTLHTNRLPRSIKHLYERTDFAKKTEPGDIMAWQRVYPCDHEASAKTAMCIVTWHDTKPFHTLSTDPAFSAEKYKELGLSRKNKEGVLQRRSAHAINLYYNSYMAGVDLSGQLQRYLTLDRRGKRWYMRVFWWLMEVTLSNAFLIHRSLLTTAGAPRITQTQFREQLVEEMLSRAGITDEAAAAAAVPSDQEGAQGQAAGRTSIRQASRHHVLVKARGKKRGRCVVCPRTSSATKTPWLCKTCEVFVHLNESGSCLEKHIGVCDKE